MTPELDLLTKAATLGPDFLLVCAMVLLGKWYLPRLDAIVKALQDIATAQAGVAKDLAETRANLEDVKEDMARVYAVLRDQEQPSRSATRAPRRPATGGVR